MAKDTLTISEAVQLYDLLAPFWPKEPMNNLVLFAGTILKNMRESEHASTYVEAVSILSGFTPEEIRDASTGNEVLDMFLEGITKFNVVDLKTFVESLGYGR